MTDLKTDFVDGEVLRAAHLNEITTAINNLNLYIDDLVASSHMVNITQMSTIYDSEEAIQGKVPDEGNGARYLVKTNGSLPLFYYSYNASEKKWEKGYQIKPSTIYLNLQDNAMYRYTMSSPYFIKLAPNVQEFQEVKTNYIKKTSFAVEEVDGEKILRITIEE